MTTATERETRGPKMNSGVHQPPLLDFTGDLTVTTAIHVQPRWVLASLDDTITWARMKLKPKKSRCLILKKGRINQQVKLKA